MDANIRYMARASLVFKLLSALALIIGVIQIVLFADPLVGVSIIRTVPDIITSEADFSNEIVRILTPRQGQINTLQLSWQMGLLISNTALTVFCLYTSGVVLDYFSGSRRKARRSD